VASTFADTNTVTVLECSNNFTEIKGAFQRRLYDASSKFKYFYHDDTPFDIEDGEEGELFDKKGKKKIGKNKYFLFETSDDDMFFLFFVNNEDLEAIAFFFFNDWFDEAITCSRNDINMALGSYSGF
jgi:hypothetical protein